MRLFYDLFLATAAAHYVIGLVLMIIQLCWPSRDGIVAPLVKNKKKIQSRT